MNRLFTSGDLSSGLKTFFQPMLDWIANGETKCRDAYFAQATDLADLEQRIRRWERSRDRSKLC
ncbi:MAG: DUF3563 family protein [Burkholderiales bacterium]